MLQPTASTAVMMPSTNAPFLPTRPSMPPMMPRTAATASSDIQAKAHVKLVRYVGNVVIDRLAEALADNKALVKIQIRLAGAQRHEVTVFVVLFPVKVGAEALLGTGNSHIAVVADI